MRVTLLFYWYLSVEKVRLARLRLSRQYKRFSEDNSARLGLSFLGALAPAIVVNVWLISRSVAFWPLAFLPTLVYLAAVVLIFLTLRLFPKTAVQPKPEAPPSETPALREEPDQPTQGLLSQEDPDLTALWVRIEEHLAPTQITDRRMDDS